MSDQGKPGRGSDQFPLRMPDGMRDRIKKSAERHGRSMNAEIVHALEMYFPPEPTLEQVLERIHLALKQASIPDELPYRAALIEGLEDLEKRLVSGLEFDQYQSRLPTAREEMIGKLAQKLRRLRRAEKYGVELADLKFEIDHGLFANLRGPSAHYALEYLNAGDPSAAMKHLRLQNVKFVDPDAAYKMIADALQRQIEGDRKSSPDTSEDDTSI